MNDNNNYVQWVMTDEKTSSKFMCFVKANILTVLYVILVLFKV